MEDSATASGPITSVLKSPPVKQLSKLSKEGKSVISGVVDLWKQRDEEGKSRCAAIIESDTSDEEEVELSAYDQLVAAITPSQALPAKCRSVQTTTPSIRQDAADHSGISGIPVQYLNKKAKAMPKYHGLSCGCICVPVVAMYRCDLALLLCRISQRRCRMVPVCSSGASSSTKQSPAFLEVQTKACVLFSSSA